MISIPLIYIPTSINWMSVFKVYVSRHSFFIDIATFKNGFNKLKQKLIYLDIYIHMSDKGVLQYFYFHNCYTDSNVITIITSSCTAVIFV